jgi:hypothetical protein
MRKDEHWERKAGRIQYEFRTRISNKGRYLASYCYNSSGYSQGPFNKEFHKRQVIKEYCEYTSIPMALIKYPQGNLEEIQQKTLPDVRHRAPPSVRHEALHRDRTLYYALCYAT